MDGTSTGARWGAVGRVARFYRAGFRGMTVGRALWVLVVLKLIVLFGVVKPLFFPDVLAERFASDAQRADHVLEQLSRPLPEASPRSRP